MVGNVTVTGVGAVPRVYLVNRRTGIDGGFLAGTLAQEYLADATALLFWAVTVPFLLQLPPEFRQIQMLLAIPLVLLLLGFVVIWRRGGFLLTILKRQSWWNAALRRLPGSTDQHINGFGDGLTASFQHARTGWAVVVLTLIQWAAEGLIFWILLLALGGQLRFWDTSAVMAYTYLVVGVPSVPGFVGTLEVSTVGLLLALGAIQALALAYVVLLRVFFTGPTTIVGLILASRAGWNLRGLLRGKTLDNSAESS
jgi:uncharacterized protein (TIRG00374 family)